MDDRVAQLEQRLRDLEGRRAAGSGRRLIGRVVPPEVRRHFISGQREQLLAVRALVDHWIDQLERRGAADPAGPGGREDIPIE